MSFAQLSYRKAALHGATGFGLLIALYDTLISDLRNAAQAQRNREIEPRCKAVNHGLLVLGFLQSWIDRDVEGELANQLLAFYSRLRSSLITAQVKQSPELLEESIASLLSMRKIWQAMEAKAAAPDTSESAEMKDGRANTDTNPLSLSA